MDYDEKVLDLLGLRLAYVEGRNGNEGALGALESDASACKQRYPISRLGGSESWSIVSLRLKDL